MPFVTAKKDVIAYKEFKASGTSPFQGFAWGELKPGKVLRAKYFAKPEGICCGGVHAFTSKKYGLDGRDTRGSIYSVLWKVIIPKGTTYFKASVCNRYGSGGGYISSWGSISSGTIVRAPKMRLVKKVS